MRIRLPRRWALAVVTVLLGIVVAGRRRAL
jgi:hypothetical protein